MKPSDRVRVVKLVLADKGKVEINDTAVITDMFVDTVYTKLDKDGREYVFFDHQLEVVE